MDYATYQRLKSEGYLDYAPYMRYLELKLSPERHQHSLGVMREMRRAAEIYKLDKALAEKAGLLHDAAKDMPLAEQIRWLEQYDPDSLRHNESCPHEIYFHGPVGAILVSKALGCAVPEMLDAIRCHAGNYEQADESRTLSRCLLVADVLAPVKNYFGRRKLQMLFYAGDLNGSELLMSVWVVEYFTQINVPIHPAYAKKIDRLTKRLNPPPSFFDRE